MSIFFCCDLQIIRFRGLCIFLLQFANCSIEENFVLWCANCWTVLMKGLVYFLLQFVVKSFFLLQFADIQNVSVVQKSQENAPDSILQQFPELGKQQNFKFPIQGLCAKVNYQSNFKFHTVVYICSDPSHTRLVIHKQNLHTQTMHWMFCWY